MNDGWAKQLTDTDASVYSYTCRNYVAVIRCLLRKLLWGRRKFDADVKLCKRYFYTQTVSRPLAIYPSIRLVGGMEAPISSKGGRT